jgi:hypothetical protein
MTDERIIFRGVRVLPDWPERIRVEQAKPTVSIQGTERTRVRFGDEADDWGANDGPCGDCAVIKGEFHVQSCDVERCPVCGGQLWFGCDCE